MIDRIYRKWYNNCRWLKCERAGTGRQARLRGVCLWRTSSSLVSRTKFETLKPAWMLGFKVSFFMFDQHFDQQFCKLDQQRKMDFPFCHTNSKSRRVYRRLFHCQFVQTADRCIFLNTSPFTECHSPAKGKSTRLNRTMRMPRPYVPFAPEIIP